MLVARPNTITLAVLFSLAASMTAACSSACPSGLVQKGQLCVRPGASGAAGGANADGTTGIAGTGTGANGVIGLNGAGSGASGNGATAVGFAANGSGTGANGVGTGTGANGVGIGASGNGANGFGLAGNANGVPGANGMAVDIAKCGNGTIDMGETCDPVATCPIVDSCASTNVCLKPTLVGMPSMCNSKCELTPIETCMSGDGCCPKACNKSMDDDCSDSCGDGLIGMGETCEPTSATMPCPASCDDMDPCTKDMQTGTPAQCNVACTHTPITQPAGGDMCCPPGANANNDTDCKAMCGNGVKEGNEICDGMDCPPSCDDKDPCTADKLMGSAAACTAVCSNTPITRPAGGDDCCPDGANSNNDSDCSAKCGNGVKEGSEKCDGSDCPSNCDDRNPCTMDIPIGNASQCTADCSHRAITGPANNDGCCPDRANANNDNDCRPKCGNGVTESGETCDGSTACDKIKSKCGTSNACLTPTYIGSEAACTLDCGAPRVTGTNGGKANGCGGCNKLEYPGIGKGNTKDEDLKAGLPCSPSTSSLAECATAGLTYCGTKENLLCRLNDVIASKPDDCTGIAGFDDNCNGTRDENAMMCP